MRKAAELPEVMSPAEVAKAFRRSARTLRDWDKAGHLRPFRVGRSLFYRADDVRALIARGGPPDARHTWPHPRGVPPRS